MRAAVYHRNWLCFVKSAVGPFDFEAIPLKSFRSNRLNTGLGSFEIAQVVDLKSKNLEFGFVWFFSHGTGKSRKM